MALEDDMQIDSTPADANGSQNVADGRQYSAHRTKLHIDVASVEITSNLDVIHLAVQQFDVRFILRALRGISSLRKRLGKGDTGRELIKSVREARSSASVDQAKGPTTTKKGKTDGGILPEEEVYLSILEQVSNAGLLTLSLTSGLILTVNRSYISTPKNLKTVQPFHYLW